MQGNLLLYATIILQINLRNKHCRKEKPLPTEETTYANDLNSGKRNFSPFSPKLTMRPIVWFGPRCSLDDDWRVMWIGMLTRSLVRVLWHETKTTSRTNPMDVFSLGAKNNKSAIKINNCLVSSAVCQRGTEETLAGPWRLRNAYPSTLF